MTKRTSSRSAKDTLKTDAEPDTNGTPLIDENFGIISVPSARKEVTGWTLQFANGGVHHIRVKGGRGRISFSGGGRGVAGEVRVYRNESTKVFDAVFSGVTHVISDAVETIPVRSGTSHPGDTSEPNFTPSKAAKEKAEEVVTHAHTDWAKFAGAMTTGTWKIASTPPEPPQEKPKVNPEDF